MTKNIKKLLIKMANILDDKTFLKIKYFCIFKKKLNLKNPKTFNEKLQWLKLYDRKQEYVKMVDKYDAKKYVSDKIGIEYVVPTFGVFEKFDDIDFSKLPDKFVIKCTHDSGGIVICKNKKKLNYEESREKINKSLKQNYYKKNREWPYKNIKPRIICEQLLEDGINDTITDYKFMCFNGKVECSFVCLNRNSKSGLNVDFYDIDWKRMPFERHYKNSNIVLKKPKNYDKMIELAQILSKNIPFLRVDFYEVKGKIYFGELTFYPGAGFEEFNPEEWDYKLGELIELPDIKK